MQQIETFFGSDISVVTYNVNEWFKQMKELVTNVTVHCTECETNYTVCILFTMLNK